MFFETVFPCVALELCRPGWPGRVLSSLLYSLCSDILPNSLGFTDWALGRVQCLPECTLVEIHLHMVIYRSVNKHISHVWTPIKNPLEDAYILKFYCTNKKLMPEMYPVINFFICSLLPHRLWETLGL